MDFDWTVFLMWVFIAYSVLLTALTMYIYTKWKSEEKEIKALQKSLDEKRDEHYEMESLTKQIQDLQKELSSRTIVNLLTDGTTKRYSAKIENLLPTYWQWTDSWYIPNEDEVIHHGLNLIITDILKEKSFEIQKTEHFDAETNTRRIDYDLYLTVKNVGGNGHTEHIE